MITARAPGKLILSGEHAVVYGHPALALAVDRHVAVTVTPQSMPGVTVNCIDLNYRQHMSLDSLNQLRFKIRANYQRFQENMLGVRSILETPAELALFALSLLTEKNNFSTGINIKTESSIPIGSGMGSSAAMILSILFAVGHYLKLNFSAEAYYSLALEAENMQHGRSSGLDVLTSLNGGCLYRHAENYVQCTLPTMSLFLVNTGVPEASTGECVMYVAPHFKHSKMGDDFADVTNELYALTQNYEDNKWKQVIRANHQLLNTIGIVPEKVAHFIDEIEKHQGAAKICGAGSVAGDSAGMVLVFFDDELFLKKITTKYNYSVLSVHSVSRGAYVV